MEGIRRHLFAIFCLLALCSSRVTEANGRQTIVKTLNGKIQGSVDSSTKGRSFLAFRGIPYAQPPERELRFRDPVKAKPWTGVRNGTVHPNICLQVPERLIFQQVRLKAWELHGDEDCLYLNVFTPMIGAQGLPVMVFLHGGLFIAGSTKPFGPEALLNHNIVLVTIQYRLGVLGFLSTEDDVIPGNYGLKDQLMALQWVQENIHLFGGDPRKVTLFGHSAGATSVHFHMMSPKSKGLFHRAIMQSGTAINPFALGLRHRKMAFRLGLVLGCGNGTRSRALLTCLQEFDAQTVVAPFQDFFVFFFTPLDFAPRVDGDILPDDPNILLRDGKHEHMDIMMGVTSHEGAFGTIPAYDNSWLLLKLAFRPYFLPLTILCCVGPENPEKLTDAIYDYYLGKFWIGNKDNGTQMVTNQLFKMSHDLATKHHAKNVGSSKSTFRYELTHRGQRSSSDYFNSTTGKHWVSHCDDLYYLFNFRQFEYLPNNLTTPDDLKLRDIMTTMWTNFATYGNPTPDDSLGFKWEPSSEDDLHYLDLNPSPIMALDQRKEVRRFHLSLPTYQNYVLNPELVHHEE